MRKGGASETQAWTCFKFSLGSPSRPARPPGWRGPGVRPVRRASSPVNPHWHWQAAAPPALTRRASRRTPWIAGRRSFFALHLSAVEEGTTGEKSESKPRSGTEGIGCMRVVLDKCTSNSAADGERATVTRGSHLCQWLPLLNKHYATATKLLLVY